MPWKVTAPMEARQRFIQEWLRRELSFSELCASHEISRKTGYKWLERYKEEGFKGLAERSHAPHTRPWALSNSMQQLLLDARVAHPKWGPRKLLAWLQNKHPRVSSWPAPSTVGDLLKRHDLVLARPRRVKVTRPGRSPFDDSAGPNAVHCIDFKGWFRTQDGAQCNPLTITDAHSRFLLCCQHVDRGTGESVKAQLVRVFSEYGVPNVIHSDNGPPFGSRGLNGLSALSVWLLSRNIGVSFSEPGRPEQNGRHERMHLTLQIEVTQQPAANLRQQQRAMDQFRHDYNWERPHEALGNRTPGSVYQRSPRRWPVPVREPAYPDEAVVRRVRGTGQIKWRGELVFVGAAFTGYPVALIPIDDGEQELRFYDHVLGVLDERTMRVRCG